MGLKQTIDFTTPNPAMTANYSLPLYQGCDYNAPFGCWSINYVGGFFKFNLALAQQQGVNLIFQLCSSTVDGTSNCPINITVNGQLLVSAFDPHIGMFYDVVWSVPASMLRSGDNEVLMTLCGGSTKVFMKYAIVDLYTVNTDLNQWLSTLPDTLPISDINLPGTHDSAAINTTVHTPYACHRFSITQQLGGGVRLLDVRLKVTKTNNQYGFVTCHGNLGSSSGINEYQTFPSLLDECAAFLSANSREMIVMSLKVDDWSTYGPDAGAVLQALAALLSQYPTSASASVQTLGAVRGKIVLLNRITDSLNFGVPVSWQDNTAGSFASASSSRNFQVYVQDQYNNLPLYGADGYKLNLVTAAFGQKSGGMVVLNFASAVWLGVIGVYVMGDLLTRLGASPASNRPANLGWLLFDYVFEQYQTDTYGWLDIVMMIVSSNSAYSQYPNTYQVLGHDEL